MDTYAVSSSIPFLIILVMLTGLQAKQVTHCQLRTLLGFQDYVSKVKRKVLLCQMILFGDIASVDCIHLNLTEDVSLFLEIES